jgi:hypothetical protein
VSYTADGASTQLKFNNHLEKEIGKERGTVIENKCSMHLGVNLRAAQVKALRNLHTLDDREDSNNDKDQRTLEDTESDNVQDSSD